MAGEYLHDGGRGTITDIGKVEKQFSFERFSRFPSHTLGTISLRSYFTKRDGGRCFRSDVIRIKLGCLPTN